MAKTGRPPNVGETQPFKLTIPKRQYDYLTFLAKKSFIGASEPEVAAYLLTQQITQMLKDKFHELEIPGDD
jgi:hypothetical protein